MPRSHPRPATASRNQAFDLTGRAAIITGGSKGLGQAMAAGLASAGADVMLVSRHAAEVEQAAAEIARDFGRPPPASRPMSPCPRRWRRWRRRQRAILVAWTS